MSSFEHPHAMFLFALKSGGRKLTYGKNADDAFEVLCLRLTQEEIDNLIKDDCIKIRQAQMQEYIHMLK